MRVALCGLLLPLVSASAFAQRRLPIPKMHRRAAPADAIGPRPRVTRTPMPLLARDSAPSPAGARKVVHDTPGCPAAVWLPMRDAGGGGAAP